MIKLKEKGVRKRKFLSSNLSFVFFRGRALRRPASKRIDRLLFTGLAGVLKCFGYPVWGLFIGASRQIYLVLNELKSIFL
jgi:hypothetical protein